MGDGVGATQPSRGLPLNRRSEVDNLQQMGTLDTGFLAKQLPSPLLLAAAAEICGHCGGLHNPSLNSSAVAELWNAHVAGRALPAVQEGRRLYGANVGAARSFPLGAWRISNVADIVPRIPYPIMGGYSQRYTHVATHALLAATTNANSVAQNDMKNPSLRQIFVKFGSDWSADFDTDSSGGQAKYAGLFSLVPGFLGFFNDDWGDDASQDGYADDLITIGEIAAAVDEVADWVALMAAGILLNSGAALVYGSNSMYSRHSPKEYAYRLAPNSISEWRPI